MATTVQLRRGTTTEHSTFAGAIAEVTVDTDKNVPVVHDGITQGGFPLARESALNALDSNYQSHKSNTNNPHGVTKTQIGLGNVTNDQQVPKAGGTFTGAIAVDGVNITFESGAKAVYQDDSDNVVASIYGDSGKGTVISGEGTVNTITLRTGGIDRMTVDDSGVVRIGGSIVWHAGNDGVGSGLNADQLQGKSSNFFASNTAFQNHAGDTGNPHQVTKSQVGLGNVANSRQLDRSQNLGDLPNVSMAKGNLGLGTDDSPTFNGINLTGSLSASGHTASLHKINFDNNESGDATQDGDLIWDLSDGLYTRRGGTAYQVWDKGNDGSLAKVNGDYSGLRARSTTKYDVGLGNVPNTNTTNANNITSGTLSSNRLSGTYDISIYGDAGSVDGYHSSDLHPGSPQHSFENMGVQTLNPGDTWYPNAGALYLGLDYNTSGLEIQMVDESGNNPRTLVSGESGVGGGGFFMTDGNILRVRMSGQYQDSYDVYFRYISQ